MRHPISRRCAPPSPTRGEGRTLEPALLPRQPIRLDAVADAELADRFGQVIAHRALRQVELGRDLAGGQAFTGEAQRLALAVVERIGFATGFQREYF